MNISQTIINRVVEEMLDNAQDMGKIVVVPNTYDVYIHADDFRDVARFLEILREQIVERLDGEIRKRNKTNPGDADRLIGMFNKLLGFEAIGSKKEYRRVDDQWHINFEECNGKISFDNKAFELKKGEVGIVRRFSSLEDQHLDSEFKTLVTIYQRDNSVTKTLLKGEKTFAPRFEVHQGNLAPHPDSHFATLKYKYKDSAKTHVYLMTTAKMTIGRRADEGEVDLSLNNASDRVSRKHLEIRFDVNDGKFFLKSFGVFGTTLNGIEVPNSYKNKESEDLNIELELNDASRISLAGGEVIIDFFTGVVPK